MMKQNKTSWLITGILIVGALFILFPLYLAVVTAFKAPEEMGGNLLSLPQNWSIENFKTAIEMTNFWNAFKNSTFITIFTVVFSIFVHSIISYVIARNYHKKFFRFVYYYIVSAMFIPFTVIMLPLVKQTSSWNMDNPMGVVVLYIVLYMALNVFLYVGYIRTIPIELEEAAVIDGANTWQIFWKIIFPLLRPMTATVAILTGLAAWNDFMLPLVILSDQSMHTLPLVQYVFQTQFSVNYNLAFASYLMAMLPMIIIYVVFQKWIISGILRGSGK